jgi:hypothetical protein
MKFSPLNILLDDDITVGSFSFPVAGKESSNILLDDTLRVYASVGDLDISIFGLGGVSLDVVALMNVYFDQTMTIQLYDAGNTLLHEETFTVLDWYGFDYKYIYMLVPDDIEYIERIRVFTTGDDYTEKWIGYAWAGMLLDFGCIEDKKVKIASISNDGVQIGRTNHPHINESYLYREIDFTTNKRTNFETLRALAEIILTDSYGKGRPWIMDWPPFYGEMIFGNLDSGKVQLDWIYVDNDTDTDTAQTTIGVREVT